MAKKVISIANEAPRFEFQLDNDGEVFSLPAFDDVDPSLVVKISAADNDVAKSIEVMREFIESENPGIVGKLTNRGLNNLANAWRESSEMSGKS